MTAYLIEGIERMTNKEKEAEFKRNLVMESAWMVFMEKGYNAATMNEIAEKSDYALGTIYKLFENKQEIFLSLVKKKLEQLHSIGISADDPSKNPVERITQILIALVDYFNNNIRMLQLFWFEPWTGDMEMIKGLKMEGADYLENFTKFFMDIIEDGQKKGYFKKIEPSKIRLALKAIMNGFFWDNFINENRLNSNELVDEVMSFFLYGIANQPQIPNQMK